MSAPSPEATGAASADGAGCPGDGAGREGDGEGRPGDGGASRGPGRGEGGLAPIPMRSGAGVCDLESDSALLRRAFGPRSGPLDPQETEALRDALRRRTLERSGLRHDPVGTREAPAADRPASGSRGEAETVPPRAARTSSRSASGALIRQRLRVAALGAVAAAAVLGVGAGIWAATQPRPALALQGTPVATSEIEDILDAQPTVFEGFSMTDGMSYGEAYGLRVIGTRLTSAQQHASLDCLWFVDSGEFVMPLCTGVRERPGYPRLLDIWRDGDALLWNPAPSDDLRQIRISIEGDRLELWEQVVGVAP
jgi:hypothetical protein